MTQGISEQAGFLAGPIGPSVFAGGWPIRFECHVDKKAAPELSPTP
jgi:hypothetical protein